MLTGGGGGSGEVHHEASVPGAELPPLQLYRPPGPQGVQPPHDGQGLCQNCRFRPGQVSFSSSDLQNLYFFIRDKTIKFCGFILHFVCNFSGSRQLFKSDQ